MRIISGQWRGRKLERPPADLTRPMPDRVRAAVFDILGSYYQCPGKLPPFRVADMFAGSGSIGLEALSRGAGSCVFFERAQAALKALRNNIASLAADDCSKVIVGDAWNRILTQSDSAAPELIFLDPPYADSTDSSNAGSVALCLTEIGLRDWTTPLVVLHHARKVTYADDFCPLWQIWDRRTFGSNAITMVRKDDDSIK